MVVEIEENSISAQRIKNEKLIVSIISEKFALKHKRLIWDDSVWKYDIYSKKVLFKTYLGYVYPSEHRAFTHVVLGGDPNLFMETAKKLEANGIEVTIQTPML